MSLGFCPNCTVLIHDSMGQAHVQAHQADIAGLVQASQSQTSQLNELADDGGLPSATAQDIIDAQQQMRQDILQQMQQMQQDLLLQMQQMQQQMQQQMNQMQQQMENNHAAVMARFDHLEQRQHLWCVPSQYTCSISSLC
jgi:cell division septum initiation protein DivIVA